MSLLEDFRPRQKRDPLFGEVVYDARRGLWQGFVDFPPTNRSQAVLLRAGREGPREEQHRAFELLRDRYDELAQTIADELFALYRSFSTRPEGLDLDSPDALWASLGLDSIALQPEGAIELVYLFTAGRWDEARFVVELEDGEVRARGPHLRP